MVNRRVPVNINVILLVRCRWHGCYWRLVGMLGCLRAILPSSDVAGLITPDWMDLIKFCDGAPFFVRTSASILVLSIQTSLHSSLSSICLIADISTLNPLSVTSLVVDEVENKSLLSV